MKKQKCDLVEKQGFLNEKSLLVQNFYAPSPKYPAACRSEAEIPFQRGSRDERQGEPRRSSIEQWRVKATAQFRFDIPQPACCSVAEIQFTGLRGVLFLLF